MPTHEAQPDGVRRRNLSRILRIVHHSGSASRSELTAQTRLNRSTVAALVAELVALGLVAESEPAATNRVGRPSPVVSPHPSPVVVAVNPELDAVTVGLVGLGAHVEHRIRHEVDHAIDPAEVVDIIAGIVAKLADELTGRRVLGVGLAVPGLVRADGLVRWAPHLGWTDAPIVELAGARLGLPVHAGNDASLGATAEHLFGVGRAVDHLIYLNGGASGIGGGVIADGRNLGGAGGYAGEFGKNRPGVGGTLEDEVSRARLLGAARLGNADEEELAAALLASTAPDVVGELARQRSILATAISNAVNVLNPELVVLGGFLATVLASDPAGLETLVERQSVPTAYESLRIRPAALGADRLLIGAAELALAPVLGDPSTAASAQPPPG